MNIKQQRKSVLLLELMTAIVIIAVVFLFVGRAYGVSKKALKRSSNFLKISLLLEEKIWELEEKAETQAGRDSGDFSDQSYGWKVDAENIGQSRLNLVTLEVFRKSQASPENFSVVTYFKDSQ